MDPLLILLALFILLVIISFLLVCPSSIPYLYNKRPTQAHYSIHHEPSFRAYTERIYSLPKVILDTSALLRPTKNVMHPVISPTMHYFTVKGIFKVCGRTSTFNIPRPVPSFLPTMGLSVSDINRNAPVHPFQPSQSPVSLICVICLENIQLGHQIRILPCEHSFHAR